MVCGSESESLKLVMVMRWELRLMEDISKALYFYEDEYDRNHGFYLLELLVS